MKHTDRIDGNIGQDLTYCEVCGLEADECKCDAALVDELADDNEPNERLKANRRARS